MQRRDKPVTIGSYMYLNKKDHRDGTRVKSQWSVSVDDEINTFALGMDRGWLVESRAWGLHLKNGLAECLGQSARDPGPVTNLSIAFFQLANPCHGYPSDPKRNIKEIPPNEVRGDWLAKGYFKRSVLRKITRGQK
jgi:hypothetical protein